MLRLVGYFLRALLTVSLRRIRGRQVNSRWSLGFETLVTAMRGYSGWLGTRPFPHLRREAARLTQKPSSAVTARTETLAGVSVLRCANGAGSHERVLVYLHGGAFVFGSPEQDGALIARLALRSGAEVIAPSYRLAPEHPYPAAVEDALATYRALLERGHAAASVSFVGLSSGGAIVLDCLVRLRDAGEALPSSVVLLSPMLDCTASAASWRENAPYDWGPRDVIVAWARTYAGDRAPSDPGVSPLHADLRGLPPALVVTGELELGRDDAKHLVDRMNAAGTKATLLVGPDMVHAFVTFDEKLGAVAHALDAVGGFLRSTALGRR